MRWQAFLAKTYKEMEKVAQGSGITWVQETLYKMRSAHGESQNEVEQLAEIRQKKDDQEKEAQARQAEFAQLNREANLVKENERRKCQAEEASAAVIGARASTTEVGTVDPLVGHVDDEFEGGREEEDEEDEVTRLMNQYKEQAVEAAAMNIAHSEAALVATSTQVRCHPSHSRFAGVPTRCRPPFPSCRKRRRCWRHASPMTEPRCEPLTHTPTHI